MAAAGTPTPVGSAAPPRSLADDLRSRGTDSLVSLLRARPDLAVPVPTDIATLAARATTRASIARALDRLTAPELQVAEVLAVAPEPTTPTEVSRLWGADAAVPLESLHGLALLWVGDNGIRLVRMVRDLLGPTPAGLGPPLADALDRRSPAGLSDLGARLGLPPSGDPQTVVQRVSEALGDPERVAHLLATAPDGAARILDRLVWGPPVGMVGGAVNETSVAVTWLLRHGLLAAADEGRVVLPREVGLARRGGRVHRRALVSPPALDGDDREPAQVDRAAAGAAAEAVRLVGQLLAMLDRQRVTVLRTGGLGVRELRRVATQLGADETVAALVCEAAWAADLVVDDEEADPSFVVSAAGDDWRESTIAERWAVLARAWLGSVRVASLVGGRDHTGTVRAAWSDLVERPAARELRAQLLDVLAAAPPGRAVAVDSLLGRLTYQAPRRAGAARDDLARSLLDEAAWLGLTGLGALATAGRALVSAPTSPVGGSDPLVDAVADALPVPVDRILIQGDLTAVAPGPLVGWLDAEMQLLAEVESQGAATVYRFTADSVRRALDAGGDADALLATLARASGTGVPQPLEYLVRDVARRHGVVRVGSAGSYVRSDDEAALAELLADRRAAGLGLRRLAPTVLASPMDPVTLLRGLRAIGAAPVVEGDGVSVPEVRSPARRPPRRRPVTAEPAPPPERLREAVERWRIAEAGPRPGSSDLPRMDPAISLSVLRQAIDSGHRVWIGYVDETGRATQRLVVPRALNSGRLTADEVGRVGTRLFSVHRVTGAVQESVED